MVAVRVELSGVPVGGSRPEPLIWQEDVAPGETLFIPRGVIHGFVNETEGPTKVLCVLTPGVLGPEYFREMAVAMEGPAPPDPKKLGEIMNRYGLIPAPAD